MKALCQKLIKTHFFEPFIVLTIVINCVLIGVETYFTNSFIQITQFIALIIFIVELIIRYTASNTTRAYFKDGWNVFDLSLVLISLIPEAWFATAGSIITLRLLRVFRVLRLLKANEEVRLIVAVLSRSFNALFYNMILFLIFLYLFGIIGVTLFQLPNESVLSAEKKVLLLEYVNEAPNTPLVSPDPYMNLSETMFTLFRVLTGEDWTDIRYNLIIANQKGLIYSPPWVITAYHVFWYVLSVFLLLNLMVGAILNNYQIIMTEFRSKKLVEKNND